MTNNTEASGFLDLFRSRGAEIAEFALDEVQDLFMSNISRGGDHETIGGEPVAEALDQVFAVEAADSF